MKRYIGLLLALLLAASMFTACGNKQEEAPVEEQPETEAIETENAEDPQDDPEATLESHLDWLEDDGWKKTDDGYLYVSNDEACLGKFYFNAKGNDGVVKVVLDYGSDNSGMIDFYKGDKTAAKAIAGHWFAYVAEYEDINQGQADYSVYVGEKQVSKGHMTLEDANSISEEYFSE